MPDFSMLDDLGRPQHGLVTASQLVAAGVADRTIRWWRSNGRLVEVAAGTYRIPGAPTTHEQVLLAQCLAFDGLASHRSASHLFGARGFGLVPPEYTVERGRSSVNAVGIVHECGDLAAVRGRPIAGVPCVTPERVAVEMAALVRAREVSPARFDDLVEHLVRAGHTSWRMLDRASTEASRARSPGVGHLRDIVGEYVDDGAESRLERRFLHLLRNAGVLLPVPQVEILDERGFVMRADFAWPDARVAAELDSVRFHLRREAFEADRVKRNRARLAGWLVLEFTSRHVRDEPRRVISTVEAALLGR